MLVCISSHVNEFQVWGDDQLKPASQVLPILEYRNAFGFRTCVHQCFTRYRAMIFVEPEWSTG